MKKNKHKKSFFILPFLLLFSLLFLGNTNFPLETPLPVLRLLNRQNGEIVAEYPLQDGTFSISFLHSVNLSKVEDFYQVQNQSILITGTSYYQFGAGVQTQLEEGQTLDYLEDGAMFIGGMNTVLSPLYYNVSPVYDHILTIDHQEISLKNLEVRTLEFIVV